MSNIVPGKHNVVDYKLFDRVKRTFSVSMGSFSDSESVSSLGLQYGTLPDLKIEGDTVIKTGQVFLFMVVETHVVRPEKYFPDKVDVPLNTIIKLVLFKFKYNNIEYEGVCHVPVIIDYEKLDDDKQRELFNMANVVFDITVNVYATKPTPLQKKAMEGLTDEEEKHTNVKNKIKEIIFEQHVYRDKILTRYLLRKKIEESQNINTAIVILPKPMLYTLDDIPRQRQILPSIYDALHTLVSLILSLFLFFIYFYFKI